MGSVVVVVLFFCFFLLLPLLPSPPPLPSRSPSGFVARGVSGVAVLCCFRLVPPRAARVYGHRTTAMHKLSTPPPPALLGDGGSFQVVGEAMELVLNNREIAFIRSEKHM